MRLIDADEAYKVLTDYYHTRTPIQQLALKEALARVPTIDVEPIRHGKWIKENIVLTSLPPKGRWHCSRCGSINDGYDESVLTPYCPNCGAKMDEVNDEIN